MKKTFLVSLVIVLASSTVVAQNIKLSNPHSMDPNGNFLHNGAFGSTFNIGPTLARIEEVQSSNIIESWNRMATGYLVVDRTGTNYGNNKANSLLFGGDNSGEYILSKRTAGPGLFGLDFLTSSRFRLHIGSNGAIGVGVGGGGQASVAQRGRFHINNSFTGETNFQQNINLYASSGNEKFDNVASSNVFSGQRAGIVNQLSGTNVNATAANSSLQLFRDILPSGTIYPAGNTGIVNNLRMLTAPRPDSGNTITYRHVYGIINDLNDQQLAKYTVSDPWGSQLTVYNSRIGLLSATNTNNLQEFGSGKIAGWFVNRGGRTAPDATTPGYMDGWGLWVDGATFLRSAYWTISDEKLKENIKTTDKNLILSRLMAVRPVTYNYVNEKGSTEYGIISQEIAKIFPEMTIKAVNPATDERILAVQYQQLHSILISAIQAQQETIQQLQKQITKLSEKLGIK
ncbi:MAG: tail fiber domain-containing protein [Bacteroidetes bacterium]|nr:tail fiber domain-containing protein [Bacteroidota bacterium]